MVFTFSFRLLEPAIRLGDLVLPQQGPHIIGQVGRSIAALAAQQGQQLLVGLGPIVVGLVQLRQQHLLRRRWMHPSIRCLQGPDRLAPASRLKRQDQRPDALVFRRVRAFAQVFVDQLECPARLLEVAGAGCNGGQAAPRRATVSSAPLVGVLINWRKIGSAFLVSAPRR